MAIVREQSNSGFASSAASKAVLFGSNNTAGNVLIAFVLADQTGTNSIADSQVNTWVSCGADSTVLAGDRVSCWYVQSCKVGANTVTGSTTHSGGDIHVHIYEISGLSASPQLDQSGRNNGTTDIATVSTAGSVAQSTEYVLSAFSDYTANHTITAGSGYTIRQQSNNSGTGDVLVSEDINTFTGLSGTQTATASGFGGTDHWTGYIVTFKGASAAANTDPPFGFLSQPSSHYINSIVNF